jgi:hypothetical protein
VGRPDGWRNIAIALIDPWPGILSVIGDCINYPLESGPMKAMLFVLLVCLATLAHATSVVAKVGKDKIVIAADTLGIDAAGTTHEDQCKIVPLGKYVFAAASIATFSPTWPNTSSWDSKIEAQAAHKSHEGDIEAAASDWRERAERYFSNLRGADRLRARSMVASSPDHVLAVGVFVGWNAKGKAEFILEAIRYKEPDLEQIEQLIEILGSRDLPYTENVITAELIEGHTSRTSEARKEWEMKSKTFPKAERDWRWLEFLIQKTGTLTQVGQQVDVFQFTRTGHSEWLQRRACEQ